MTKSNFDASQFGKDGGINQENKNAPDNNCRGCNDAASLSETEEDKGMNSCEGIVYKYTCKKPGDYFGKSYIGVTPDEKTRRRSWNNWGNAYSGSKIEGARSNTEPSDWEYEVLEKVFAGTEDELTKKLEEREAHYIEQFDSFYNGFNGNKFGSGRCSEGYTDEQRAQTGDATRGRHHSEETKAILREKNTGRKHTPETCDKISQALSGLKRTSEQRAAESARMKGKTPFAACEGAKKWQKNNPGGWWGNPAHPITPQMKANMSAAQQKISTRVRVILNDGSERCFISQLDTANYLGVGVGSINYAINNNTIPKKSKIKIKKIEKISDAEYQEWIKRNPQP